MTSTLPLRRTGLSVRAVDGEHIVLDANGGAAHRLAPEAAAVLDLCDGRTSVDDAAQLLALSTAAVDAATDELLAAGLADAPGHTRRRMLQGGAVAGAALVSSVVLPRAAAAESNPTPVGGGGSTHRSYNLFATVAPLSSASVPPFSFLAETAANTYVPVGNPYSHPDYNPNYEPTGVQGNDPASGGYPTFYTTSGEYTGTTIDVPANRFALHPGSSQPAAVGFTNPTGGTVALRLVGTIIHRDTAVNPVANGVALHVVDASGTPASGTSTASTTGAPLSQGSFNATFATVGPGETVYVVIDNNGTGSTDYYFDSTELDLTVTVFS